MSAGGRKGILLFLPQVLVLSLAVCCCAVRSPSHGDTGGYRRTGKAGGKGEAFSHLPNPLAGLERLGEICISKYGESSCSRGSLGQVGKRLPGAQPDIRSLHPG
eukprot:CAMPEP_0174925846 /NCGR_PEP_ID=MMETSP1355-20121228/8185_1 /TAXON_ID=464990 /ORGANISM="Hemiselmis tepida, Strain CCMP443" /LENGTH=103 /DNA_ID=CAMNT_0016171805 /DNA_START=167 /DNA_END=474 /DNA_ORIENTATION=+